MNNNTNETNNFAERISRAESGNQAAFQNAPGQAPANQAPQDQAVPGQTENLQTASMQNAPDHNPPVYSEYLQAAPNKPTVDATDAPSNKKIPKQKAKGVSYNKLSKSASGIGVSNTPQKKKSLLPIIIIIAVVLLAAIGVFAFFALNKDDSSKPDVIPDITVISQGECGDNVVYTLYSDGSLVIEGEGEMRDSDIETSPWKDYTDKIESVTFKEGITYIGDYSFWCCTELKNVSLPKSLTEIGESAFEYTGIEEITFHENIAKIGDSAFAHCKDLKRVSAYKLKEQWAELDIGTNNGVLAEENVTFLVIPEPVEEDNVGYFMTADDETTYFSGDSTMTECGDGIPDKYQKKLVFKIENGTFEYGKTERIFYVTLMNENIEPAEDGTTILLNYAVYVPTVTPNEGYTYLQEQIDLEAPVTRDSNEEYLITCEVLSPSQTPQACTYCGSTAHSTANHPKCAHCGSREHTTANHPKCGECGSIDHTTANHPKCLICGSKDHATANHNNATTPQSCIYCGSYFHTSVNHPKCPICGSSDHSTHPQPCTYCGSTAHTTEYHPVCPVCGSTAHTTHTQVQACSYCGSTAHTTAYHPKCPVCGSTDHSTHPQPCTYCGSSSHTTESHPLCPECGSPSHAMHPTTKCTHCGSTEHSTTNHPRCAICNSKAHTTANHTSMCDECGSRDHTTANHPMCEVCGSKNHTTDAHPMCEICGLTDHITSAHPRCPSCGATDHSFDECPISGCIICGSRDHSTSNHGSVNLPY